MKQFTLRIVGMLTAILLTMPAFAQALSGTYTINPVGSGATNFPSFTAAVSVMSFNGISGQVTFDVSAGTYNEQISIGAITGSSATNTITFRKSPTATTAVVLTFPATSTNNYTIRLTGASNITFQNLTIANTAVVGQATGALFEYGGSCANIQLLGNTFNGNAGTNTNNVWAAMRYGSTPSTGYATGKWVVEGNTFNNISYGVNIYGSSSANADSVRIRNNTINSTYYGIYTYYAKNPKITGNTLNTVNTAGHYNYIYYSAGNIIYSNNTANGAYYGLYCANLVANNLTFENNVINYAAGVNYGLFYTNGTTTNASTKLIARNNKINSNATGSSSSYGIYFTNVNATVVAPSEISNNLISMPGTSTGSAYGIYPVGASNANIYHNTVSVNTGSATGSRALYVNTTVAGPVNLDIRNNIFSNTGLGYAVEINSAIGLATISNLNNNVYNGNVLNPFRYNAINHTTLAAWQTAVARDANSVFGTVNFYATNDLHVQNAIANNMGTPLASVLLDYDGQARSTTTPDAGADEYTPNACIATAVITAGATSATTASASWTTTNTPVSYKVRYKATAGAIWTKATQTAATLALTGLTSGTTYEVQVKEFCTAADSSIWSASTTFVTPCVSATIPYVQDFSTFPVSCWNQLSTGDMWLAAGVSPATTGIMRANFYNWISGRKATYQTQPITIPNAAHIMKIDWSHLYNATYPNDMLVVRAKKVSATAWDTLVKLSGTNFNTPGSGNTSPGIFTTSSAPLPASVLGGDVQFEIIGRSGFGQDLFVDNFNVSAFVAPPTCPITNVPAVATVVTCGPQSVVLTATGGTTGQAVLWYDGTNELSGFGNTYNTPVLSANAIFLPRFVVRDNSAAAISGGPAGTLANPVGGFGNFTNGTWVTFNQAVFLDSVTVKADLGTVNFQVRLSAKAGTKTANTGAEIYLSNPISVTSATATGEMKRVYVGMTIPAGSYYLNLKFNVGTTGKLFRSTALPTGQTYPFALGTVGSIDSVQYGATGSNLRVYYLFNYKVSKACVGNPSVAHVTYAGIPSTALPYTVNFNAGLPCNWTKATIGAAWNVVASYGTASSLNGSKFAFIDDDGAGSTVNTNSSLISPVFAGLGYDTLKLKFDQYYFHYTGQKGYVELYAPNASGVMGWTKLDSMTATSGAWAAPVSKTYNITNYQSNDLQVRFRLYDGNTWGWYWAIDNFKILGTQSQTGKVRVQAITDIYGTEASWKIKGNVNKLTYAARGPWADITPYNVAAATHIDTVSLPLNGTYEFRFTDSYGDGLTDGTNIGGYTVDKLCLWGDVLIKSGTGAFVNDPGGATANIPSYDSAVFNMACVQPATYLVRVNMNQQTVSTNGVHIAGNFQGWNPATTAMTDANGDGVYEYTINTTMGAEIEYKFINGTAWGVDESVPTSCRYKNSWNRGDSITSAADTAATVCFAECSDCSANVTFQVNMSKVAVNSNGVHIAGNFQGWNPGATAMTDANGDSIYEVTVSVPSGMNLEFKYINGNAWGADESVPTACRVSGSWNRGYSATFVDDSLDVVCFAQCTNCTVDVTLVVDMNRELPISADGVHVAGNFQGWNPGATALTDANGDNVFEATVQVPINTTANYKFINGNSWASGVESLDANDGSCVVNDGGGNYNRSVAVAVADIAQDTVCFGRCVICGMNVDEQMGMVSVFPNPTTGAFTIERGIASGNVAITVMNVQGQVIETAEWVDGDATLRLEASNYAEGVYFVRMTTDAGSSTLRVAVQR